MRQRVKMPGKTGDSKLRHCTRNVWMRRPGILGNWTSQNQSLNLRLTW